MKYRPASSRREALRKRVRQLYEWYNERAWDKCFSLVDPKLRAQARCEKQAYADSLGRFMEFHGKVQPWHLRINLHLDASSNKQDPRPFAYVYLVWQDEACAFHMFRERWVEDGGRWFTRVVGLVANTKSA